MRLIANFLLILVTTTAQLLWAQELLLGRPSSWPSPEAVSSNSCTSFSGVYANDPIDKKPPSSYKFDTFVHTAFLFTPGRLKVPDWVWKGDTGSVEVRFSDGGLEFVARSKNGVQTERRFIDLGAIQCRANVLYLT